MQNNFGFINSNYKCQIR